jgi:hypothetical protein
MRHPSQLSDLIQKLRDREVSESEFHVGFEQVIYTKKNPSQKSLVQYILKKVAIHQNQPFVGETDDLTIEHLLPQSAAKNDKEEALIGEIGNLMLIDAETNGMLSTNKFSDKRKILLDRGYKLPLPLMEADEISEEVIRNNTSRISELAWNTIWEGVTSAYCIFRTVCQQGKCVSLRTEGQLRAGSAVAVELILVSSGWITDVRSA